MARGFRRHRGRLTAKLDADERALVAGLLEQTRQLLLATVGPPAVPPEPDEFDLLMLDAGMADPDQFGPDVGAAAGPSGWPPEDRPPEDRQPEDPAARRLLPPGHRDDPRAAAEFRRLTSDGLRDRKAQRLLRAAEAMRSVDGDQVTLERAHAEDLLVGLTDVRLVLGERLALRTDSDAARLHRRLGELDPDDPMLPLVLAYEFLTWLQESLAEALTAG